MDCCNIGKLNYFRCIAFTRFFNAENDKKTVAIRISTIEAGAIYIRMDCCNIGKLNYCRYIAFTRSFNAENDKKTKNVTVSDCKTNDRSKTEAQ